MSVKFKLIAGLLFIIIMIAAESALVLRMNRNRDRLAREIVTLYQVNSAMKDRIIDVKGIVNDVIYRIAYRHDFPVADSEQKTSSCVGIMQSLEQWAASFPTSPGYPDIDPALLVHINAFIEELDNIRSGIDEIREIDIDDNATRMEINENMIIPAAAQAELRAKDFISNASLIFAIKNTGMIAYSRRIEFYQFLLISLLFLMTVFVIFYSQYLLRPLNWLMEGVSRIRQGDLKYTVRDRGDDELGRLARQFNSMSSELKEHREHLEDLVRERTERLTEAVDQLRATNRELEDARRIMNYDMSLAANVQESFLVGPPPNDPEWEIALHYAPMSSVSGDFYDFFTDNSGRLLGLSLMDVSGHGVASGLITMIGKLICHRVFFQNTQRNIGETLAHINDELIQEIGSLDNYVTGIMLKFTDSGIEYVNAGHTDLLLADSNGTVRSIGSEDGTHRGLFLGIEEMRMDFAPAAVPINRGETLFLYTDGLIEAMNSRDEIFGMSRLSGALASCAGLSASETMKRVIDTMLAHTAGLHLKDDCAAICLKRK